MNEAYTETLSNHRRKIEHFISVFEGLQQQIRTLQGQLEVKDSEVEALKIELENKRNQIKELEQKKDNLQLAGAFNASVEDAKEAKQNINRLVREIDKCIVLLSNGYGREKSAD